MEKLRPAIINRLCGADALKNELLCMPSTGDVGFEEYFNLKAETVHKKKSLFLKPERCKLVLRYPKDDRNIHDSHDFGMFFESPMAVSRNHVFEGVFAIDISDYVTNLGSEKFVSLMSFALEKPNTVFLFFFRCDSEPVASSVERAVSGYMDISYIRMERPSAEELASYTIDRVRDFVIHLDREVKPELERYFSQYNVGFEASEKIVRFLNTSGYRGDLPGLKTLLADAHKSFCFDRSIRSFGF